jgi:hypothetical protein
MVKPSPFYVLVIDMYEICAQLARLITILQKERHCVSRMGVVESTVVASCPSWYCPALYFRP